MGERIESLIMMVLVMVVVMVAVMVLVMVMVVMVVTRDEVSHFREVGDSGGRALDPSRPPPAPKENSPATKSTPASCTT